MKTGAERSVAARRDALASFTNDGAALDELLAYNNRCFQHVASPEAGFPLEDELFVEIWRGYAREVREAESIEPLARYLPQLNFPVEAGISESADYLQATRSGAPPALRDRIQWQRPKSCDLIIHPTPAGHIPVLTMGERRDFETLLQALTKRNEPYPIPPSMGAAMIANYTNWHRIRLLREKFESSAWTVGGWKAEFVRIKASKELYQDRFILLSSGPYSGVLAADIGLDEEAWSALSVSIRREHECAHYFTKRVFGSMQNNLLDEVLADYFGIIAATGRFQAEWFLRFFGIEDFPSFRVGGRLENYRGSPPLSDTAFTALQKMLYASASQLERFDAHCRRLSPAPEKSAIFLALAGATMEDLASEGALALLSTWLSQGSTIKNC